MVSAGQVNVSFGRDELEELNDLKAVSERTGIPLAVLMKRAMKAVMRRDRELFDQLASFAPPDALVPALVEA